MSRTIDERIVEMRFDNRQFEQNVQTSLSTLDKLKRGLDLDNAAKSLDGLGDAAKRCDMSVLGKSVETVQAKFSAFQVVAMTTLSNITNSAAVQEYAALGLADTELSFELPVTRARSLGGFLPQGILAYGYLPLMALRNCPIKAAIGCGKCRGYESLTDRKGVRFTVDCGRHDGHPRQVSELYNSVPLWLADRLGELEGLSFLTLWFTRESAAQCEAVVRSYAEGRPMPGAPSEKTRGLYYRTVL